MGTPHERRLTGLDHVVAATALLQRQRAAHPTAGLYEAADVQWRWRAPRPSDARPQLFWFDDDDRPVAAVILTAWLARTTLDVLVLPGSGPDWVRHVVDRGVGELTDPELHWLICEADPDDEAMVAALEANGFTEGDEAVVEAWLDAADRPPASPLADGYRLSSRAEQSGLHHMVVNGRNPPETEERLRQTSLYRADLDLVVLAPDGMPAAYGLFWYDPVTGTGLVEPMRTEDDHQRRGLARHVLTAGVDRLAAAGAERIKICYEPDNPASGHLYRDVGFRPVRTTVEFVHR